MDKVLEVLSRVVAKLDNTTIHEMESRRIPGELEAEILRLLREHFHPRDSECLLEPCDICNRRSLSRQDHAIVGMMMAGGSSSGGRRYDFGRDKVNRTKTKRRSAKPTSFSFARVTGLEPAASSVTGTRSNQIELHPHT